VVSEIAWPLFLILLLPVGFLVGGVLGMAMSTSRAAVIAGALALICLLLFKQRIQVDDRFLRLTLGIGIIRRRWPLDDVVQAAKSDALVPGLGVKKLPDGTAYALVLGDLVRVELRSGRAFYISTGKADELIARLAPKG
jgi:hypothetical protein